MSEQHTVPPSGRFFVNRLMGVPLDSTGEYEGCQLMPGALRATGLLEDAGFDAGNLQVALADPRRNPVTNVTASDDLLAASRVISDATYDIAREELTPLFVGGDCSMLIGIMNGLRRHDPDLALIMVDGHFDMHTPQTSESGDAADMEITLLTDPASPFSSLNGTTPALPLERIAFIGPRDHGEMIELGSPLPHDMIARPFIADQPALTHMSVMEAATAAIAHLRGTGASKFWLHVDLDVLSTDDMPAVDYPQPGGLSWADLHRATRVLIEDPGFRGISVAVLNPNLDKHGTAAKKTAGWLNAVLSRQQETSFG